MARHDSGDSSLEEGEARRDYRTARHHRSSRDRDSRRRADSDSSEFDREIPISKTDREARKRRDDDRDKDVPDRDSKRRVDRRREDRVSSDPEEDRDVRRGRHDRNSPKLKGKGDRRREDRVSSESEEDREARRRRHDRHSPKLKSRVDEDILKSKLDKRRDDKVSSEDDREVGRRKHERDSPKLKRKDDGVNVTSDGRRKHDSDSSESDPEKRDDHVLRDSRNGDRRRHDRYSPKPDDFEKPKGKLDGDIEIRERRDRDSSRGGDKRGHDRDLSKSEDFERHNNKVDGDAEFPRDSSRGGDKRRHDMDSSKSREDIERHKNKVDGDGELRDKRDRNLSRRGDKRRRDKDSPKSDEDVENISKNKRDYQNGGRESHHHKDRDSRRGDRRRCESHTDSSEEEKKSKERKSRSEVGKKDEKARREDNYRGRGTDENSTIHEKRIERRKDERFLSRGGMEDEDIQRRRERDGYEPRENELKHKVDDGKKVGNPESGNNDPATLGRTGGIYIPPFKLAQMMKQVEDKSSVEYQRLTWDALRKSINGLVNKVNAANIKNIVTELFEENLIRGRGLFCRSCMKSQMASPGFTDVFSALVAVVNTKFPEVGELLLRRIILQLKRAYKRNDKHQLLAAVKFIAHLVNQQVAHEIIALELLTVLLENPTDDSVEVAVGFIIECGSILQDLAPKGLHGIFERFRGILHEGEIDKRVQFLIEGLFAIRKAKFQGHPAVRPELDLVDQEDQLTHELSLESEIDPETSLDIFKPDPNFLENEKRYDELSKNILGDESGKDEESSEGSSDDEEDQDSEEEEEEQMKIKDETETNLVNLRRTIYLTIMSSVDFEEAGHKLLKIRLEPGQEMELCIMLLECCSQERTYLRYYGLLGQRFCIINRIHQENFEKCFVQQYSMIHRLETNKLRNVAKFFAHLLGTDALPWHVLSYIRLTEEDTTSSSRIFIKILFQELSEHLGIRLLNERLTDPTMQDSFESIFPKNNPKNTRFSINFFTSIGLGGITEALREYLKNMPRLIMQQQMHEGDPDSSPSGSSSASGSSSSSGSESSSSSESEEDVKRKRRRRK